MTRCVTLNGVSKMIDLGPYAECACKRMGNTFPMCKTDLMLEEQGKKVTLTLRAHEEARALVLDGCVFTDNDTKCDALYLYQGSGKKVMALVELKGANDIHRAFEQLSYTRWHRPEYADLKERFKGASQGQLVEKAFVVSNGMLSKPEKERLEKTHRIRVMAVLHSEPVKKVPDLREYLV